MEGVCLIVAGGRDTGMVRSFLEYDSLERTDDGRPTQQASVDLLDACPHVAIIERSFHRVAPWTVRWRARAGRWVAHLVPDLLLYTSPCSASKPVLGAAPFPPYLGVRGWWWSVNLSESGKNLNRNLLVDFSQAFPERLKKEKKKHKMVGIVVRDGIHGGLEELEGRIPGEVERRIPEEARGILQQLASSWSDVVDSMALEVVPLKGAMTNEVYQVNWPTCAAAAGKRPRTVLVRIYGEGVDVFFDREEEIRTFECMSRHGQGPLLLGRFLNGRVEEFIHARTLSAVDLRDPEISGLIASKLREFHDLDMPGHRNVLLWGRLRYDAGIIWLCCAFMKSSPYLDTDSSFVDAGLK
ncbi:hypothetical protein B296_00003908 [Ensete ventricosum]|uniref:Rieske domain-containing protein n=1 Tax=Ensete ventricosum TaxID=4639 RepID=A0A427B3G9_ENSVE|nr:hypothetical protein B296_00003908 [Ensete ventricosum]